MHVILNKVLIVLKPKLLFGRIAISTYIIMLFGANCHGVLQAKSNLTGNLTLSYKRIHFVLPTTLELKSEDKFIIDSLFSFADRSLQKSEIQIGYKTSGDIYFELYFNQNEYHSALIKTKLWHDYTGEDREFESDKTYPLAMFFGFKELKKDISFYTNYFLLQEFLGGFGLKQRISNSESRHLPKWLTLGYCAIHSSPWSAFDEDEYSFYEQNGAFAKLQSIPNEANLIFGKYIWSQLLKQNHRNAISSFWFIVKFTQSIDEAFQFQFHQGFNEWMKDIRGEKHQIHSSNSSDVSWTGKLKFSPIIDLTKASNRTTYIVVYQSNKLILKSIDSNGNNIKIIGQIPVYNFDSKQKLENIQLDFDSIQNQLLFTKQLGGLKYTLTIDFTTHKTKQSEFYTTLKDCFQGLSYDLIRKLAPTIREELDRSNEEVVKSFVTKDHILLISQSKLGEIQNANPNKYLIRFSMIKPNNNTKLQTLRIDTLENELFIKSIAQESTNRYSYADGSTGVWKLRFIEFDRENDLKWHTGMKGSFFFHKSFSNSIWEISYDNQKPVIQKFEAHTESKQEIISLIKQNLEDEKPVVINRDIDSAINTKITPFHFIGKFPKRSWDNRLKGNTPLFYTGEFQIAMMHNTYYLKHASLQLSNYENNRLGYYLNGSYNQLINNPLTPNLQLELTDIRARHLIQIHGYSSFNFGRLGLNFSQTFKINKNYQLQHVVNWRLRSLNKSEISIYKNTLFYNSFSIQRNWQSGFQTILGLGFRSDGWYQRLSSLSSLDLLNNRLDFGEIVMATEWKFTRKSNSPNFSLKGIVTPQIQINYSRNLNLWNQEYSLQSTIEMNIFKILKFKNLLKSVYSQGKYKNQYFIGGSTGWIKNLQYISEIPPFHNSTPMMITKWAGSVRGHLIGTATGSSYLIYNGDLIFPIKSFFHSSVELSEFIKKTSIGIFLDAGMAFYFNQPGDLRNPHNTWYQSTGNFDLWTSAKRNPWIYSYGFVFQTSLLGMPVKYEYAVPFTQNIKQKNVHLFGLIWDF